MFSNRDAYDSDSCPVRDELLGEMYRANEHGLARLVDAVSSDVRAMLALFCYRRSHLYALSLSIASSCSGRASPQRWRATTSRRRSRAGSIRLSK